MVDQGGFRRIRRAAGVVMATCAAVAGLAAQGAAAETPMQALYGSDGTVRLFANGPTGPFAWEQCSLTQTTCAEAGTGREINVSDAPDGTIFRLSAEGDIGISPTWHGNLTITAPPSVQGTLRVGEVVTPVLATWQGGWDGSIDQTQLAACQTPTGENCESLTDPKYIDGLANGAVQLEAAFAGDYLRIADSRLGAGAAETADAYSSPHGHPIWPADGSTAVAIVGQIAAGATSPPSQESPRPAPTPSHTGPTSSRVKGSISSRGIATVRCDVSCGATLVIRRGGRAARHATTVKPKSAAAGVATIRPSRADLERLGPGRAYLVLEVEGEPIAHRTIMLPSVRGHRKPRR
jgi:hypothetical protein